METYLNYLEILEFWLLFFFGIEEMNLERREETSSVDDGCLRTDSSCCASSQSPHTHMNMSLIKWTEFLSQYCCSPTWSNMGGFLPKPVSKVSWTEVFNSGVGRGNSSHIGSQQRHCKDIRHTDRAGKRKERSRRIPSHKAGELLFSCFK